MNTTRPKIIAVVDDESSIRQTLKIALEREGYEVWAFENPLEALETCKTSQPDLILLDVLMPYMNGIDFCKSLKMSHPTLSVIFLSSKNDEIDRILGLEVGGDDYIGKPFSINELLARVRVQWRRQNFASNDWIPGKASHDLVLVEEACLIFWKGTEIRFTVTEFRIIQCLAKVPGHCKTRDQLVESAYPDDTWVSPRTMDTHIKRIRQKFASVDSSFSSIEAVHGLGYRFREKHNGKDA